MESKLSNIEKLRGVPWFVAHNGFNSVFCAFTFIGSIFILFLNELGFDKSRIGFLMSLFPFCGLIALLAAPSVARFGYKRTVLICLGLRKLVFGLLLLTPWVLSRYGGDKAFLWIAGILFCFAVLRAVAETGVYPWQQEFIPDYLRGKVSAFCTILSTGVNILAVLFASYIISHYTSWGLNRYTFLIAVGLICGLISVCCFYFIPGGESQPAQKIDGTYFRGMIRSLSDRNYRTFLFGMAMVMLGISGLAFAPLFLKEQIGLTAGQVIFIDIGSLAGGLISCYMWGWASDRFGSKPVMITGPCLSVLIPILWFLIPRHDPHVFYIAIAIAFFSGMAIMGWTIGSMRYLYVNAVPRAGLTTYMAVFYAWIGLVGGIGPFLIGPFLDWCRRVHGEVGIFTIDPFTPLLGVVLVSFLVGLVVLNRVRADGALPVKRFWGMFMQGNVFVAMESMIRYSRARDESARVQQTQRLGDSKNPLTARELIEALNDPSFNVRFEAVIAISRMPATPELVDALLLVLAGSEPDLGIAAAWALGKLGDRSAILPLQEMLLSEYRLLAIHSARALAKLNDTDSVPFFIKRLHEEPDDKLRLAYASALGMMRVKEAVGDLLTLLQRMNDPVLRDELTLAVARIIGPEWYYMQLWRSTREDFGTSIAQAIYDLSDELSRKHRVDREQLELVRKAASAFSQNSLEIGVENWTEFLSQFLKTSMSDSTVAKVIEHCAEQLMPFNSDRKVYMLLSLQAVNEENLPR
jgi:HEAT repeat protein/Na+/melibiose symporter-like transporter